MLAKDFLYEIRLKDFVSKDPSLCIDRIFIGREDKEVKKAATCMVVTPDVLRAAAEWGADIIVSHEPTFHGDCDDTVPLSESITMLSAVNGWDGKAQIKICHGLGHNAWDVAYAGDELINWFLSHKRETIDQ